VPVPETLVLMLIFMHQLRQPAVARKNYIWYYIVSKQTFSCIFLSGCDLQAFDGGPSSNTDDEASSTTRNSSNRISSSYRIKDRNISSSDQVTTKRMTM
jgi:hypothetical protein